MWPVFSGGQAGEGGGGGAGHNSTGGFEGDRHKTNEVVSVGAGGGTRVCATSAASPGRTNGDVSVSSGGGAGGVLLLLSIRGGRDADARSHLVSPTGP